MKPLWLGARDLFVSLRLTVFLLLLSIALIFWATLSQADLGVWGVQQKFFHSVFVLVKIPGTEIPVPLFPGGYLIGGLLLLNLLAAHFYRFRYTWRKTGIWLTHAGLILLLVGELLSGLEQKDYDLTIANGQTLNYAESQRDDEVAIIDDTDPKTDVVTAIPNHLIASGLTIQTPALPFRVVPQFYFPNVNLTRRENAPGAPPSMATAGVGPQIAVIPLPATGKENERNMPAAYLELVGPDGSLGSYLVSSFLEMPQHFSFGGRDWKILMRPARRYFPFSVTLLKFSHDIYPGTDIPRNFSSRVRLNQADGSSREFLIHMNSPLRYGGLTFFQASFLPGDQTSILEVVRNPSWRIPYLACALMAIGLVAQFGLHLAGFARRQRTRAFAPA